MHRSRAAARAAGGAVVPWPWVYFFAAHAPHLAAHLAAAHLAPHFAPCLVFDMALALTALAFELPHFAEHAPQRAAACFGPHLPAAEHAAVAALPPKAAAVTTAEARTRER